MIPAHAVTGYLVDHGFPDADATMAGIRGTGRARWIAAYQAAEFVGDELIADWISEAQAEVDRARAVVGVVVTPRQDFGPARVASWWAHLDIRALTRLMDTRLAVPDVLAPAPVRMHLSTATVLLRAAGLGEPLAAPPVVTR